MSAALVESVREASQAQMRRVAAQKASTSGDLHGMIAYEHQQLYALDLPAILAALTEAESLRAQVAASQARGVALREALAKLRDEESSECGNELGEDYVQCNRDGCNGQAWGSADSDAKDDIEHSDNCVFSALSAPTDTAALRAMLEAAWLDGADIAGDSSMWWGGGRAERASDIADEYVDRVLGGS